MSCRNELIDYKWAKDVVKQYTDQFKGFRKMFGSKAVLDKDGFIDSTNLFYCLNLMLGINLMLDIMENEQSKDQREAFQVFITAINQLEKRRERELCYYLFILGKTASQAAQKMGVRRETVQRKKNKLVIKLVLLIEYEKGRV